jgi:hypothetical protein
LNVAVRKSTFMIVSTHGKTQNRPGPLAPPEENKVPALHELSIVSYLAEYDQHEE